MIEPGKVYRPTRDRRVKDAVRLLHERRSEAARCIALWERSTKPYAADERRYWTAELKRIEREIAKLDGG